MGSSYFEARNSVVPFSSEVIRSKRFENFNSDNRKLFTRLFGSDSDIQNFGILKLYFNYYLDIDSKVCEEAGNIFDVKTHLSLKAKYIKELVDKLSLSLIKLDNIQRNCGNQTSLLEAINKFNYELNSELANLESLLLESSQPNQEDLFRFGILKEYFGLDEESYNRMSEDNKNCLFTLFQRFLFIIRDEGVDLTEKICNLEKFCNEVHKINHSPTLRGLDDAKYLIFFLCILNQEIHKLTYDR